MVYIASFCINPPVYVNYKQKHLHFLYSLAIFIVAKILIIANLSEVLIFVMFV